jgi:hypothetical protein
MGRLEQGFYVVKILGSRLRGNDRGNAGTTEGMGSRLRGNDRGIRGNDRGIRGDDKGYGFPPSRERQRERGNDRGNAGTTEGTRERQKGARERQVRLQGELQANRAVVRAVNLWIERG